jgi:predicted NBD/HSP70 family sugar kinase
LICEINYAKVIEDRDIMMTDPKINSRRIILDTIRRSAPIARIDLARATDISQATVTTITSDLIRQGLIREVTREEEPGQAKRGRPRIDLMLRGDAYLMAGLKVSGAAISVVLVDFECAVICEHKYVGQTKMAHVEQMLDEISNALHETCQSAGVVFDDISAIGVGIAGMVNAERGFVHWSPFFAERNLEFGPMLSDLLGKPVFLDNDANLVAMAEQYLGLGRDVSNFIVVTIEHGVGMGIVINDRIYRGVRGCGAEFGHTKVQLDGALCRCGQRGCLEAYVADYALLREASFGTGHSSEPPAENRIKDLLDAARANDPTAASIVNRSSRMFAMGLSNLVNIFDPELIILSGERMQFDHLYAEDVMASIKDQIVQVDAQPPEIVIHKWGDFMWARGAAAFALGGVADLALSESPDRAA